MNFQTMNKQRKFVLIAAAVGIISMFLPWISVSVLGFSQTVNGMHDKGILVFLCFAAAGIIAFLGDQTKNLDKTMWGITLIVGAIALLMVLWFYFDATGNGSPFGGSFIGFGLYISGLASLGILIAAYMFRAPTDNLKDSFNTLKKDIESKINTPAKTSTPEDNASNTGSTNPPA
jgi:peptidoglycan/LPS O-acetylase OafA/YrhL